MVVVDYMERTQIKINQKKRYTRGGFQTCSSHYSQDTLPS